MQPFLPLSPADHRRRFLQQGLFTAALASPGLRPIAKAAPQPTDASSLAFCVISDTHYFANAESPGELDERSLKVCSRLVDTLNHLPGTTIPNLAGGGIVQPLRGIIHAGDVIDSGDKRGQIYEKMQRTEWEAFVADFGLHGTEGRLRFPIFELHGNHDSPSGEGLAIEAMRERTARRKCLSRSANGLHYSWDWGPIHFIQLGIVVGQDRSNPQRRRYHPMDSLEFLIGDLQQYVGDSGRPVVISHHVDILRYSQSCSVNNPDNLGMEWNPCDVQAYYRALTGYQIIAIFHGHTHARQVLRWNGSSKAAQEGFPLWNVDNSSHFQGGHQAFFYVEIGTQQLTVRECATQDAWETSHWSPTYWSQALRAG
jgi:hypothetical protein